MGPPSSANHHRRRSSILVGSGIQGPPKATTPTTRDPPESSESDEAKQQSSGNDSDTDLSADESGLSDEGEMVSDDDIHDDEETGLTSKERNKRRRRRRRQRRRLDARIAHVRVSKKGQKVADKEVVKRLVTNAVLIGLWYIFSLSISIYNKWMFSPEHLNFHFPLFTTSLHMAVQFTFASLMLLIFPSLRPEMSPPKQSAHDPEPKPLMTKLFYVTRLVPCGTATSLDIGLGNMSLKFISLTFLTMCKSSALAFVLLFAFVFRLENPSVKLILIIAMMTLGVVMMVAGETAFNAVGFALIIASAFFSGFRWGLTQILLLRHPATSNPFSTLFFLTPIMFFSLIIIALPVEGPAEIANGLSILTTAHGVVGGILLLIFPGVLAFCMIASEFALLQRSSVVTLSICGIFKEVVTISAAGIVFHDKLTPVNVSGLLITISSIAYYNYMKISTMRREYRLDAADQEDLANGDSDLDDSSSPITDGTRSPRFGLSRSNTGDRVQYHALLAPGDALRVPTPTELYDEDDYRNFTPTTAERNQPQGSKIARASGSDGVLAIPTSPVVVVDGRRTPLRSSGQPSPITEASERGRSEEQRTSQESRSISVGGSDRSRSPEKRVRDLG